MQPFSVRFFVYRVFSLLWMILTTRINEAALSSSPSSCYSQWRSFHLPRLSSITGVFACSMNGADDPTAPQCILDLGSRRERHITCSSKFIPRGQRLTERKTLTRNSFAIPEVDEQHSYLAVHKRAEILNLISSDAETIGNIAFSVSGVVTHTTFLLMGCLYIWNLLGAYLPWIIVLIG